MKKKVIMMTIFGKMTILTLCALANFSVQAQNPPIENAVRVQWDAQGKFEKKITQLAKVGQWTYLELYYASEHKQQSVVGLMNKNQKNQMLAFKFNCIEANGKAGFLIEDDRGLDRLSSSENKDVDILLDGKSYANPFTMGTAELEQFKQALKSAKTIQFNADAYGAPYKFTNHKPELLSNPVSCES